MYDAGMKLIANKLPRLDVTVQTLRIVFIPKPNHFDIKMSLQVLLILKASYRFVLSHTKLALIFCINLNQNAVYTLIQINCSRFIAQ